MEHQTGYNPPEGWGRPATGHAPSGYNPMGRVDACPSCRDQVLNAPRAILSESATGFTAAYTCHRCRRSWRTSWGWGFAARGLGAYMDPSEDWTES